MQAPSAAAELIRSFANTVDIEDAADELASPAQLATWLVSAKLVESVPPVSDEEHRAALDLRAGIRESLDADGRPAPRGLSVADAVLAGLPVHISLTSATVLPDPGLPTARRALAGVGSAWLELALTGQARRLKRCAEHSCGWVFWDTSKNQSRRWCSMRVCGNRTKARRYAARQRSS